MLNKFLATVMIAAFFAVNAQAELMVSFDGVDYKFEDFAPTKKDIKRVKKEARKKKEKFDKAACAQDFAIRRFSSKHSSKVLAAMSPQCSEQEPDDEQVDAYILWWRLDVERQIETFFAMDSTTVVRLPMRAMSGRYEVYPGNENARKVARSRVLELSMNKCRLELFPSEFVQKRSRFSGMTFPGDTIQFIFQYGLPLVDDIVMRPSGSHAIMQQASVDQGVLKFADSDLAEHYLSLHKAPQDSNVTQAEVQAYFARPYWSDVDSEQAERIKIRFLDRKDIYSDEDIQRLYTGKTIHAFDPLHGNQIEFLSADGSSALWYPGNKIILAGEWKIEGNRSVCFRYGADTYNPATRQKGGKFACTPIKNSIESRERQWEGNVYRLTGGDDVPSDLPRYGELPAFPE